MEIKSKAFALSLKYISLGLKLFLCATYTNLVTIMSVIGKKSC